MDKMLFLSMTGARENMLSQRAHANNLANVNTTGFKADLAQARSMQVFGEGYATRVYAQSERPATLTDSGALIETGNPLDVAVQESGWIAVQKPDETEGYTRAGELQVTAAGQLVTGNGLPVLGLGGGPIIVPPNEKMEIGLDGSINIKALGGLDNELEVVGRIKMVNPPEGTLFKGLDGLMRTDEQEPLEPDLNVQLRTGFVESSNVNAVHEMTSIISLSRQFELNVKMMKTADETGDAATRIMKLS